MVLWVLLGHRVLSDLRDRLVLLVLQVLPEEDHPSDPE
jgi:hypothetical protein